MYEKLTDETLQKPVYGDVDFGHLEQYIDIADSYLISVADSVVKSLNGHDMRVTYEVSDNSLIYDIGCLPTYDKENIKAFLRLHRVGEDKAVAHNANLILNLLDRYERAWETAHMSEFHLECCTWDILKPPPYHEEWEQRWHVPYLFCDCFDREPGTVINDDLPF